MNAILLGPQGVGKGTQAEIVAPRLRLARIGTGDLLREAIKEQTPLGQQAQLYYDRGALVPDAIVVAMVIEQLSGLAQVEPPLAGALFDGFPRNLAQAESLDQALAGINQEIDRVVNLDAPRPVLIARLTGRLTCAVCGTIYNLKTKPTREPGICDVCGSTDLRQRADDTEEAIRQRLQLYDEQTEPLLAYYQRRGIVRAIDGDQPIEQVTAELLAMLAPEEEARDAAAL